MSDAAPATAPTPAADPKQTRKKARKELKAIHLAGGPEKAGCDAKRFHELHYLAAGKAVPDTDPDDLD